MSQPARPEHPARPEQPDQPIVVRDRRRFAPDGSRRSPESDAGTPAAGAPVGIGDAAEDPAGGPRAAAGAPEQVTQLRAALEERTADLQRVKAEYDNYRRRADRDRQAADEAGAGRVLAALLGALDDIDRAEAHGDLVGPFRTVADALQGALARVGLERFGAPGEAFDPGQHEALMHSYSDEVTRPTCVQLLRSGYRFAGRVLRPAQVAVAEPEPAPATDETPDVWVSDAGTVDAPVEPGEDQPGAPEHRPVSAAAGASPGPGDQERPETAEPGD